MYTAERAISRKCDRMFTVRGLEAVVVLMRVLTEARLYNTSR